jgi:small subunit ribosomal protein S16
LVVADSRNPRDGRFLEHVGVFDPTRTPVEIKIDFDRVNHWLSKGAQPSETVAQLLRRAKQPS